MTNSYRYRQTRKTKPCNSHNPKPTKSPGHPHTTTPSNQTHAAGNKIDHSTKRTSTLLKAPITRHNKHSIQCHKIAFLQSRRQTPHKTNPNTTPKTTLNHTPHPPTIKYYPKVTSPPKSQHTLYPHWPHSLANTIRITKKNIQAKTMTKNNIPLPNPHHHAPFKPRQVPQLT